MNKLQTYSSYKDSGVEWLGEIPEEWEIQKVKNIFNFSKGLTITKDNLQEEGIYCVNYGEIHSKYGFEINPAIHALKCVDESYLKSDLKSLLNFGDFVFADTSEDIEGSGNFTYLNSNIKTFAGYHTVICRSKNSINVRFFAYLFDSVTYRLQIRKRVKGVKVYSITQGILKDTILWNPPQKEQTKIASFLDEKTAQIDEVISQKEKLIELLKERKQIVINDAVTKGEMRQNHQLLDDFSIGTKGDVQSTADSKNVEFIDSGVEWIGKIPKHWEINRLKFLFKIRKRIANSLGYDVLSITQKGIKVKDTDSGEGQLAMDYSKYQLVFKGDFAMNHMDLLTGYIDISKFDGVTSPDYRVFTLEDSSCIPEYYLRLFQMCYHEKIFYAFGQGVSQLGRWRFPAENFNNFFVPIPPKHEQLQIVEYIENQTTKIDKAIELQQNYIAKLKEYKASLIDSVVTGKVRV